MKAKTNQIKNMTQKIKLVYLGTPEISSTTLENLAKDSRFEVCAVITQPDKPVGRKQIITPSPVKITAQKLNLPIYQPISINKDRGTLEKLKQLKPDFLLTFAFGQILSEEVLKIPTIKSLNIHGSILPKYRGASPIEEALLNGDTTTGVSYIEMIKEMDAGAVFKTLKIEINPQDTSITLREKISELAATTCSEVLSEIFSGNLKGIPQDQSKVTFCHKISKQDGIIIFSESSAIEIYNKYRAFIVWPGVCIKVAGKIIKLIEINLANTNKIVPGKFQIENKRIYAGTKNEDLEIIRLQLEGKQIQTSEQFLNGHRDLLESA